MTTSAFILVFIAVSLVGCIMFLLGQYSGFQLGFSDGWEAAEDCAALLDPSSQDNIDAIRWKLCAPSAPSDMSDMSDNLARDFH
jgi:hypothetical protein